MNGNAITNRFIDYLNIDISRMVSIDIIVSFIQESGFYEIQPLLKEADRLGIPVRIVTSTYLNITDPTALTLLFYAPKNVETYIYTGKAPSFHPKAYFFHHEDKNQSSVYVGSSNISKTALTTGIEWNYRVEARIDKGAIAQFEAEFKTILTCDVVRLEREILDEYKKVYQCNKEATKDILKKFYKPAKDVSFDRKKIAYTNIDSHNSDSTNPDNQYEMTYDNKKSVESLFKPNSAQIEALLELNNTREEGNEKALVVAATGVGKTFLAAFDSMEYESILFVAHREEILNQAYLTFTKVRGNQDLGRFYSGYKEINKKIIFASVQTLSRSENLTLFDKSYFNYICIDELHHGVASTYTKVINYFKPQFLLGLTATPHRMDQKDVFALCDYNSVYEVDLFTSINRGWLVPYKYYGIYDVTVDYDNIRFLNGKYVEQDLEKALMINARAELVLKHFKRYRRKRALAFCSNINHAEFMADFFVKQGIKSICIHSDASRDHYVERNSGLQLIEKGDVEVIFSVDILSEGVDIASLDLLLFLRPTESPVVFLQQLGRGLRKAEGKSHVRVLDFIGNFKKVELIPFLLGYKKEKISNLMTEIQNEENLPLDCQVDFEFQVVDLIEAVLRSKRRVQDLIFEWFSSCCEASSDYHVPSRVEFFNWLDDEQYQLLKKNKNYNPFKDYCGYIAKLDSIGVNKLDLSSDEVRFIRLIETTNMSQLYKLPVIWSFVTDQGIKNSVTMDEIIDSFIKFYSNNRNRLDIVRNKNADEPNDYTRQQWRRIIVSNPINFLSKTHEDVFEFVGEEFRIKLNFESGIDSAWFVDNIKDALEFRRSEFLDQRIERGMI